MTRPSFTNALTISTTATVVNRSWTVNRLWKGTLATPRQATRVDTWKTNSASDSFPGGTLRCVWMYQRPTDSSRSSSRRAPPRWITWQMLNIRFVSPPGFPISTFMNRTVVTVRAPVMKETRATVLPTAL